LARLSFENVPTKSGGVVSGNISTGAGSPFGAGGKHAIQVADIQAEIAKMPVGYYDPKHRAPDGGAIADYPKGWRFLPTADDGATYESNEILKKNPKVADTLEQLHNMGAGTNAPHGIAQRTWARMSEIDKAPYEAKMDRKYKIIDDAHYDLVIAPQIKAEEERKAREEEEQRQTIATLKMRVQELTKKPIDKPITPAVTTSAVTTSATSYLPFAVVGIVIVVILLFLRSRA